MARGEVFQARVAIGKASINGRDVLVFGTRELLQTLRVVQESLDAIESGISAFEVINVPAGGIAATNVQAAINELDTEKASASSLGTMAAQNAASVAITGGSVRATTGLGFSNGAGGAVLQFGSKSAAVTLDTQCGEITMDSASLAAGATVTFTLNNSNIQNKDVLVINHVSGGTLGDYTVAPSCGSGAATIAVTNRTAGILSDAVVLRFVLVKAVTT